MTDKFLIWSAARSDWCEQEVVGVAYRLHNIEQLFPPDRNPHSDSLNLDVELVPEPDNEHDHNAIAVCVDGTLLGYLPADIAPRWRRTINRITTSDCVAITRGRIWLHQRTEWTIDGDPVTRAMVQFYIKLPSDPDEAIPVNDPPSVAYTLLPRSAIVRGTKESNYLDTLLELVPSSGYGLAYATLHREVVETTRTRRDIVAVKVNGAKVAELTPAMSANFLPMIDHLNNRGLVPACWADITGSSVAAKVRIDAIKAHEANDNVLDGVPVTVPTLVPEFLADWWLDVSTPRTYRTPINLAGVEASFANEPFSSRTQRQRDADR